MFLKFERLTITVYNGGHARWRQNWCRHPGGKVTMLPALKIDYPTETNMQI